MRPGVSESMAGSSARQAADGLAAGSGKAYDVHSADLVLHGRLVRARGLINNGNMCFMNAILQPLVHCVPFYSFFKALALNTGHNFRNTTPLTDAVLLFLNEFDEVQAGQPDLRQAQDAFAPEYVYDALRSRKKIDSIKGRQEDAEEFLGFLLDGLHEELVRVDRAVEVASVVSTKGVESSPSHSGAAPSDGLNSNGDYMNGTGETDTWFEVGKKNRTLVTRNTDAQTSPISRIFGGRMRSVVKSGGSKDSATLEPFQSLPLDIAPGHVRTIEDALVNLTAPETLEGFTSSARGGTRVEATKQNYIESLPPVLILHLKRFIYDSVGGTQKLHKHVGYSSTLKIRPDILSPPSRTLYKSVEYTLFAIVYHHGRFAAGGHYTCDVLRQNGEWLHIDDDEISATSLDEVARDRRDRQPYMLFFVHSDKR
ncbi:hypothetical protein BC831DRAFT_493833 [Entophlyctis helioformis]|nr:hypothetical protein BC831DRAFT_493833 [Entophlyctis helioformis]